MLFTHNTRLPNKNVDCTAQQSKLCLTTTLIAILINAQNKPIVVSDLDSWNFVDFIECKWTLILPIHTQHISI